MAQTNQQNEELTSRLSKAFRNAAFSTGMAVYCTINSTAATIATQEPLFGVLGGLMALFFTREAMNDFADGLQQPAAGEQSASAQVKPPQPS